MSSMLAHSACCGRKKYHEQQTAKGDAFPRESPWAALSNVPPCWAPHLRTRPAGVLWVNAVVTAVALVLLSRIHCRCPVFRTEHVCRRHGRGHLALEKATISYSQTRPPLSCFLILLSSTESAPADAVPWMPSARTGLNVFADNPTVEPVSNFPRCA